MGTKLVTLLLTMLLSTTVSLRYIPANGAFNAPESGSFETAAGTVIRQETTGKVGAAEQDVRTYTYPDGRQVSMQRVRTNAKTEALALDSLRLEGATATVRRFDVQTNQWIVGDLNTGTLARGMYFIRVGKAECIVITPQTYTGRENGMIEHQTAYDGAISVTRTDTGFTLTATLPALPASAHAEYFMVRSDTPLIDWSSPSSLVKWSNYRFTDANRWCYDGYYYLAEPDYYPTGPNLYYNLPGAYITCKMLRDTGEPASYVLGLAMLDVMRAQWNEQGFIPSLSGSNWLTRDYGIGPGYYDTRFNSDLAIAYVRAAQAQGVTEWLTYAENYAAFVMRHAGEHHFAFGSDAQEGWLIQDYSQPPKANRPTHASLNHHVNTATFFYMLAGVTGEPNYAAFADKLVRGVEHTQAQWIMPSGSLHYAYLPDGTMGLDDYPYLTYNDLFDLQRQIVLRHGQENASIRRLMESKCLWMDENGVTEYYK